jgi:RHS repeat-associated protein
LNSDGKYNYTYDDEGNLTRRTEIASNKVTEYQWDYRNRLAGVVDKDAAGNAVQNVGFKYDSQNRRISKKVGSNETRFVYDRDNVLFDFTANGSNQPVLDKRYFYGNGVDRILAQENANGSVLWALTDQLGTVKDWVNNSGSVANHVVYDAFGGVVSQSNPALGSRYGFTGREFDAETGLYYYRSRYYNPGIGRFIGEDSVGFDAGDVNLYRYVGNSPLDNTDPSGKNGVSLKYITAIPPTAGNCGKFDWKIRWRLEGADQNTNGYVVQKVEFKSEVIPCSVNCELPPSTSGEIIFWEAWQVRNGQVYNVDNSQGSDLFAVQTGFDKFLGQHIVEGHAKFIADYTEPAKWKPTTFSGRVPSTITQPSGWSDGGTLDRTITSTFDCCKGIRKSRLKTTVNPKNSEFKIKR